MHLWVLWTGSVCLGSDEKLKEDNRGYGKIVNSMKIWNDGYDFGFVFGCKIFTQYNPLVGSADHYLPDLVHYEASK